MSILDKCLLPSEAVQIGDESITLYELSPLHRCDHLEYLASLPDAELAGAAEGDEESAEKDEAAKSAALFAVVRKNNMANARLVAYAMLPGLPGESVENVQNWLLTNVPNSDLTTVLAPVAARLAKLIGEGGEPKKPSPAEPLPESLPESLTSQA